jgi:response regulator RpfG family c-di-GMP phosphodiesterase
MNMVKSNLAKIGILKDVQILVVDNDIDSRSLYSTLLEDLGANVIDTGSIKEALMLLDSLVPDILITEMIFLGESIDLLVQQLKNTALTNGIHIPIMITSTYPTRSFAKYLKVEVEAYLLKPIHLEDLVSKIWNLVVQAKITHPSSIQGWITKQNLGKEYYSDELFTQDWLPFALP